MHYANVNRVRHCAGRIFSISVQLTYTNNIFRKANIFDFDCYNYYCLLCKTCYICYSLAHIQCHYLESLPRQFWPGVQVIFHQKQINRGQGIFYKTGISFSSYAALEAS